MGRVSVVSLLEQLVPKVWRLSLGVNVLPLNVTLEREDPEPALPTAAVTLVCDVPAPAVPTPTDEAPGRGSVASDDSGERVFRLRPTPAAGGTGVLVRFGDPNGE